VEQEIKSFCNILVVGDIMLDYYLWGTCTRISPEAPVQLVDIQNEEILLGGAGNVAKNIKALSDKVTILSVVGKDKTGKELKKILKKQKINNFILEEKNRKTTKKSRIIATHSQMLRYDNESRVDILDETQNKLFEIFKDICDSFDLILLSDYNKGVLTNILTAKIIKYAKTKNIKVLIDPKGKNYSKYSGAYLLTPNKLEIQDAFNVEIKDKKSLKKALLKLKKTTNVDIPLVTLSEDGIAYFDKKIVIKQTLSKKVYDVTGAGDTVLASLGHCIARGVDIANAIEFANIAARIVISKIGASSASLEEIYQYINKSDSIDEKIKTFEQIKSISSELKKQNKKIVFSNGCFDILHVGHSSYLHKAKQFGDVLIVGLNSDESVKKLKGVNRPINTQLDRALLLASLESVDYVVIFSHKTPYKLIKTIKPDILVKGGDYQNKSIVGDDIAKQTKTIDLVVDKSTSSIIKKIKNS